MRSSARGDRDVVGAVPEGEVERAVAPRPAHERGRALGQSDRLGRHAAAAVAPDDLVLHAEALAQLHGLGEVARGDAHLGPPRPQHVDDGPHDEHVGAVGQVNPDPHRARRPRPRRPGRGAWPRTPAGPGGAGQLVGRGQLGVRDRPPSPAGDGSACGSRRAIRCRPRRARRPARRRARGGPRTRAMRARVPGATTGSATSSPRPACAYHSPTPWRWVGPALELGQLDAQDGRLQLVQARVVAHLLVGDPSREPWKRNVRTRSASAASAVMTAPPSPKAPRFFDG